jgi:DNA-directed RNA polymerase subunit RPC12/RpoP
MESLTSGTLAGTGSFRCEECGYVVTLAAADELPTCPGCGSSSFARASLFSGPRFARGAAPERSPEEREAWLATAREHVTEPGRYLVFDRDGRTDSIALEREWTRVGRSLAADVRFDDPTGRSTACSSTASASSGASCATATRSSSGATA